MNHPSPPRSEGLLPSDAEPEVAEEVSVDQQSDGTRQVGTLPDAAATADAIAEALRPKAP